MQQAEGPAVILRAWGWQNKVTSKGHLGQEGMDVHEKEEPKPWNILLSQRRSVIRNEWEKQKRKMCSEAMTPAFGVRGWRAELGSPVRACAKGGRVLTLLATPADILGTDAEAGPSCFHLEHALRFYKCFM